MRLDWLYVLTGALSGLLLGALAALFVVASAAGLSWLYLFGDEPWPAAVDWVLPALGVVVFLVVLLACLALALRAGHSAAALAPEQARAWRTTAIRLLSLGLVLTLLLAAAAVARLVEQEDARQTATHQGAWFESLLAERQRLTAIEVARAPRPMRYDLSVATRGARGGGYRLDFTLGSSAYGEALAQGVGELALAPGDNSATLEVDAWPIIERYHEIALGGQDVDVEVAESFRLEVTLTPLLDAVERARLPAHEVQNLALGQSALIDHKTAEFPMRFRIGGPEYELLD